MKYIIDEENLIGLLEDRDKLNRLECNGVDNWEGYDMYDGWEEPDYEKYIKENFKKAE